jgi:hypothetical protein
MKKKIAFVFFFFGHVEFSQTMAGSWYPWKGLDE